MFEKVDVLPGKKTNTLAAVFVLVQAASAAGFIDPSWAQFADYVLASGMAGTLGLKLVRQPVVRR